VLFICAKDGNDIFSGNYWQQSDFLQRIVVKILKNGSKWEKCV